MVPQQDLIQQGEGDGNNLRKRSDRIAFAAMKIQPITLWFHSRTSYSREKAMEIT